jgi:hypothetical protein
MHFCLHHQPARIHQKVAFAAVYLLGTVVAASAAFLRGPRRLTVHDRRAGPRFATRHRADALAQDAVDPLPGAIEAPTTEVVVDGLPAVGNSYGSRRQAQPLRAM